MTARSEAAQRLCLPFLRDLPVAGLSVSVGGARDVQSIVASSDGVAVRLESLQFELGEGPSVDVLRRGVRSLAFDLRQDAVLRLWPVFTVAAIEAGAGALLAFPMLAGAITVGVVSLYSPDSSPIWPESTLHAATVLVQASMDPAVALAIGGAQSESSSHGDAVELRREVHQASGMVSVQAGCSVEEALLLLRARAFAEDRSVQSVAEDVVARTLSFRSAGR